MCVYVCACIYSITQTWRPYCNFLFLHRVDPGESDSGHQAWQQDFTHWAISPSFKWEFVTHKS